MIIKDKCFNVNENQHDILFTEIFYYNFLCAAFLTNYLKLLLLVSNEEVYIDQQVPFGVPTRYAIPS